MDRSDAWKLFLSALRWLLANMAEDLLIDGLRWLIVYLLRKLFVYLLRKLWRSKRKQ